MDDDNTNNNNTFPTARVKQTDDSRFMIVYHDPSTDVETFFGGFYNDVQCPGTEDESFSYGFVDWVGRPEDGAMMFKTIQEAKDYLDAIDKPEEDCSIILYGLGEIENDILGSRWYPLQEFKSILGGLT